MRVFGIALGTVYLFSLNTSIALLLVEEKSYTGCSWDKCVFSKGEKDVEYNTIYKTICGKFYAIWEQV